MNFCGKCGTPIENNYKFCKNCGNPITNNNNSSENKEIEPTNTVVNLNSDDTVLLDINTITKDNDLDNTIINPIVVPNVQKNIIKHYDDEDNDYNKFDDKPKGHLKPIIISISIVAIIFIAFFFNKDSIFCAYFNYKGKSSESISNKIESYCKAYDFKSNAKTIDAIYNALVSSHTFDNDLSTVKSYFTENDYNDLCKRVYVSKAEIAFEHKNSDLCKNYLNEAEKYGYSVKTFKYYSDLDSLDAELDDSVSDDSSSNSNVQNPNYSIKSDYLIYDSSSRLLSKQELLSYSKYDLALIRNEIFARHGYVFETEPFKSYFNSKSWYVPNSNFKGTLDELNSIEKSNVELIQELEE